MSKIKKGKKEENEKDNDNKAVRQLMPTRLIEGMNDVSFRDSLLNSNEVVKRNSSVNSVPTTQKVYSDWDYQFKSVEIMNSIIMRWAAYCVIASCLLLDHAIASNNETLLFEGDIVPTYKSISSVYGDDFANELVGKGYMEYNPDVVRGSSTGIDLWKQNWNNWKEMYVVNVYFSPAYNSTELRLVRRGVRRIQRKTGVIKFQWLFEYPEDGTPYIHVGSFGLDICKSFVGRDSSATNRFGQFLHIGPSCMTAGAVQHEMMHALGFYHEQSRPDRDNYVTINTENILEGNEHNFQKAAGIDSLGTAYDYNSVMHYDEYTFSKDPTLKTLDAKGNVVGQRTTMSSVSLSYTYILRWSYSENQGIVYFFLIIIISLP